LSPFDIPKPPTPPHPFFPLTIGRTRPSPSTTIAALLHDIAAELPHFSIRALAASYVAQNLAIHVQFLKKFSLLSLRKAISAFTAKDLDHGSSLYDFIIKTSDKPSSEVFLVFSARNHKGIASFSVSISS
jgi:hypothetical protein